MPSISKISKISPSARIGQNVVIMDGAVIAAGTRVMNNVVIYPGTQIGKGALISDNCVLGRPPFDLPNLDRRPKRHLKPLKIGDNSQIGANVVLYRGSVIGRKVMICDFSSVREECVIEDNVVLGRGVLVNYNVKIGRNSRIMDGCHFGGDMVIEENVFMSPFISSANDNYMGLNKKLKARNGPRIKKGARIGLGCILLAGVTIGEGAVIGAGSLVSKDIEARTVAYGFPARVIRKLK